jgi:hypothetical protein
MSLYWSTKSVGGRDYTVIQHPLRDTSTKVCGVKFHCGYGVVQKESKAYKMLKSMPLFRNAKEFPLTLLKSLKFVTRSQDIALIYGKDIFITYQRELIEHNKKQEAQKFEETRSERNSDKSSKCKYLLLHNDFCNNEKVFGSNGYCRMHILEDRELIKEMGIEIPSYVGREGFGKETSHFLAKICKKIEQYTREKSKKELSELLIESNETQEVS